MEKKPLFVGNWKMELSHKAAVEVVQAIKKQITPGLRSDIVVCPSYPSLQAIAEMLRKTKTIATGAQNVYHEEKGAITGAVSVIQIKPFVEWCIIGHSEQRALTGESDEQILQKANLLLQHGLQPVICLGESAAERESDQTVEKITRQMDTLLSGIERSSLPRVVLCYEPIWAISSVRTMPMPDPQDISQIIMLIRKRIAHRFDSDIVERVRILYGGSVDEKSVAQYMGEPGVDGVLVGSASLHPRQFLDIVKQGEDAWYAKNG